MGTHCIHVQKVRVKRNLLVEQRAKHWIQEVRESLGLTQAQFAQKMGVSYAAVQKWEGWAREPRPRVKLKILDAAPAELRAALGLHGALAGKGSGIVDRVEALEKVVAEQGRALRALEQRLKRRAS